MAQSRPYKSTSGTRDAIAFLKNEHRMVESLFDEFEKADEDEYGPLARKICALLTAHAQIEEEIFYPAAREALSDKEKGTELLAEAEVEHATAKDLIAKIEGMEPEAESFCATVKVLGEYVRHHVKEEEQELFPKMRKADVDLKELGNRLAERREALGEAGEEMEPRKMGGGMHRRGPRASPRTGHGARH